MWENIINIIRNKNSIEIGGPSMLFMYPENFCLLYPFLNQIDGANMDNPWQGNTQSHFLPYPNKVGVNYKIDAAVEEDYDSITKKYDLVFSAHVLEHIANPIKALNNFKKLLNDDGMILTIVPNKTEFWDKHRETTTIEHLIEDYEKNTLEDDLTHFNENFEGRDWSLGGYDGKVVKSIEHCIEMSSENFKYRMLHHHCFDSELNKNLHEYAGYKTIQNFVLPEDNLHLVYLGKI